jgi:hypothetical protein
VQRAHPRSLKPLNALLARPEIEEAFRVPRPLLLMQLAENDDWFLRELAEHFPDVVPEVTAARAAAQQTLPRPLSDELHADRHHRAALLYEAVTRLGAPEDSERWKRWLDELFLHPRWGLIGSLAVFALVLFMVFEVSAVLDGLTSARLAEWVGQWQPDSHGRRGRPRGGRRLVGWSASSCPTCCRWCCCWWRWRSPASCTASPSWWTAASTHRPARRRGGALPHRARLQRAGHLGGGGHRRGASASSPRC